MRAHCLSFSQNKPSRILSPPNQTLRQENHMTLIRYRPLSTEPDDPVLVPFETEVK